MGRARCGRRSPVVRQWPLVCSVLIVAWVVVLALWSTPPAWLTGPRRVVLSVLKWAHMLDVAVASLVVAVASLVVAVVVPLLTAIKQRDWARRDITEVRRRAQNRRRMLQRVHNKWIKDVLEPSFGYAVEINLLLKP